MDIGTNIRKIRELKGFSQDFMAHQLELSQRQFSRIENNETDLSLSKIEKISAILEVTPNQLLGFDEKFIFQNCKTAFGNNQNYYAFSEKLSTQYEARLKEKDATILLLKQTNASLLAVIEGLKKDLKLPKPI